MHGKKGRKTAVLPDRELKSMVIYLANTKLTCGQLDFEVRTEDTKIRCKICLNHHGTHRYDSEWIQKSSLNHHERSSLHQICLEREASERLPSNTTNNDSFITARSVVVGNINDREGPSQPCQSQAEVEMWDNFASGPDNTVFQMDPGAEEALQDARQNFENKVKDFGLWKGVETMAIEDDIGCVEDAWDEAEHDGILGDILRNLGEFMFAPRSHIYLQRF
jgi:hypothetical protein